MMFSDLLHIHRRRNTRVSRDVPQGSSLGPLLLLIYNKDMPQTVKDNLFSYVDVTCPVRDFEDINVIVKTTKWKYL